MRTLRMFRPHAVRPLATLLLTVLAACQTTQAGLDPDTVALHGGYIQVSDGDRSLSSAGFEVRFGHRDGYPFPWKELRPQAGVMVFDNDSAYVYAGLRYDWDVHPVLRISPNFSLGLYEQGDGDELQLGSPIEFRSALEGSVRLAPRWRLGLAYDHISNAGIGDTNPGTEQLLLSLAYEL